MDGFESDELIFIFRDASDEIQTCISERKHKTRSKMLSQLLGSLQSVCQRRRGCLFLLYLLYTIFLSLNSMKLHCLLGLESTNCVISRIILAFSFSEAVRYHLERRVFPCRLTRRMVSIWCFFFSFVEIEEKRIV